MHWQLKKILFFLKMTVQFKFDKKKWPSGLICEMLMMGYGV
jgi:hypothetical protein